MWKSAWKKKGKGKGLKFYRVKKGGGGGSVVVENENPFDVCCWENCELLQANFHIWGSICKAEICYPGCQEACKFHRDSSSQEKQSEPVIKARGEEVLKIESDVAKWPRPTTVPPQSSLVYVVMRKNPDSSWTQIIQTGDRSVSLPSDTIASNIRVLVVDPEGLVTMYSPPISIHEKLNDSIVSRIMAGVQSDRKKAERISINTPKSNTWELKEVSLIHQKVLVLAEVSWEPRFGHSVYLVTWEVDGGGLKGNLFTDSTCVTLSLWPDTIYHIQVEVVSKTDKSVPLVLDTHKATQVSFDISQTSSQNPPINAFNNEYSKNQKKKILSDVTKYQLKSKSSLSSSSSSSDEEITNRQNSDKIVSHNNPSVKRKIFSNEKTKKDVSLEEQYDTPKSNLKSTAKITGSLSSVLVKSSVDAEPEMIDTRQRTELAFGSAAAIFLFLIICGLLAHKTKKRRKNSNVAAVTGAGAGAGAGAAKRSHGSDFENFYDKNSSSVKKIVSDFNFSPNLVLVTTCDENSVVPETTTTTTMTSTTQQSSRNKITKDDDDEYREESSWKKNLPALTTSRRDKTIKNIINNNNNNNLYQNNENDMDDENSLKNILVVAERETEVDV
ncbi:hypothetical protein Phum_PHUM604090 [Pediculus humanus corporis]|uniref:Fibronectin type-III domain-containing protein n=1 Tax=Pediculus humanus subsp. corporis TaxID=121224 RepID=E0W3F3_PEDHC|nr:uncharacterized protein Phum_PHUM604090 [Pediculus humanus corporis]EEB20159.1 hypothetical protein Phum_PHUM604090 [Pediculus humanus corporis]